MRDRYDPEVVEWAVGVLRRFAVVPRVRKSLAVALHVLATQLTGEQRFEDALTASEESVALFRQLLPRDPAWIGPRYVEALGLYGGLLRRCDWASRALAVGEEVLKIERRLDRGLPLAHALLDHGLYLDEVGRTAEGLRSVDEALERYRELPGSDRGIAKAERVRARFLEDL